MNNLGLYTERPKINSQKIIDDSLRELNAPIVKLKSFQMAPPIELGKLLESSRVTQSNPWDSTLLKIILVVGILLIGAALIPNRFRTLARWGLIPLAIVGFGEYEMQKNRRPPITLSPLDTLPPLQQLDLSKCIVKNDT